MSSRKYDSSRIRVEPVFSYIDATKDGWRKFLHWLIDKFPGRFSPFSADYSELEVYYAGNGGGELAIAPNEELLDFLIFTDEGIAALRGDMKNKLRRKMRTDLSVTERARLELFSEETREKQRKRAKIGGRFLKEFLFEGIDYPDVVIITNKIVLVIEGKLTEPHLTTRTTWLDGRDQMIRHLDSAMSCKMFSGKTIMGMYIIGDDDDESIKRSGRHPDYNMNNYNYELSKSYWEKALPHYANRKDGEKEIKRVANGYLGYCTWNEVGHVFGGIVVPIDTTSDPGFIRLDSNRQVKS